MIARLILGVALALPPMCALAQPTWMLTEMRAYQAVIAANAMHRQNDTVALLQGLIGEAEAGSDEARSLKYRLAALYYRQLNFAEAEVLIAPLRAGGGGSTLVYRPTKVRENMIPLVLRNDLAGALALGSAAVPRYLEELNLALLAEEILESAYVDAVPGSAARESIGGRRAAVSARAVTANLELARLYSALAETHHALNQLPEAEKQYRSALALFAKDKGGDPAALIHTRTGLAILLRTSGDAAAALPLQQAALADMKKAYPGNHPERLESERELAQLRLALRKGAAKPGKRAGALKD
jgi:tetratricopeptide (TPR) repeat protein